jgi:hypothetical protein
MQAVTVWLDQETERGNEGTPGIANLLARAIHHAQEIVDSDNAAALAPSLVLPPRDTQREVDNLTAFAAPIIQTLRQQADQMGRRTAVGLTPASAQAGGGDPQQNETPADGTIENGRIWLKGNRYRLTAGFRELLSYLLTHQGAPEDDVRRHCGFSGQSHLQNRLTLLRKRVAKEMKKSGWLLQIRTDESCIFCTWREANAATTN